LEDVQQIAQPWLDGGAQILNVAESLDIKFRIFRLLAEQMKEPLKFMGAIQTRQSQTLLWDPLPLSDLIAADVVILQETFDREDRLLVLFEVAGSHVYSLPNGLLKYRDLEGIDAYVLPASGAEWFAILTHEEQFGPYLLSPRTQSASSTGDARES